MKKTIMKIATISTAAVALVVVTVLVTVAYLTSSSAVSNTFTVGNVVIQMFESKVDSNGQKVKYAEGAMKDSDGNSYHLLPGETYDKDPTIYVTANSDDLYLFVKVRNNLAPIEEGNVTSTGGEGTEAIATGNPTIAEQMAANGWMEFTNTSTGMVYLYVGVDENNVLNNTAKVVKKSDKRQDIDVFETFTIHEDANVSIYGGAKVTLTAFAIQTAGFEDDPAGTTNGKTAVQKAWDAIVETYPYEDGAALSE